MPQRVHRHAAVLLGLGSFLASAVPLRAGDIDFPICGDGVVQAPFETCDDGNTLSGDGCSGISCFGEECGDGIINPDPAPGPSEGCEDGNTVGGDGCDANCQSECGNGTLDGAETCDDRGESATCDDDCTPIECGDGNVNELGGESCDDANTVSGDGCESTCESGESPPKDQQACINGINKNMAGVLAAQNKSSSTCLRNVAAGKVTVARCIGIDVGGKVAKAEAMTATTELAKCQGPSAPPFAYTTAATANATAEDAALDWALFVFGDPPTLVTKSVYEAGAACQAEVAKRQFKLQETWAAEANKAKKTALKGSKTTPGVASGVALATAIDAAVAASEKITKAENGVNTGIAKKCPDATVPVDPLFACDDAATGNVLALCVIVQAKRGACLALEGSDGLALECSGDDV